MSSQPKMTAAVARTGRQESGSAISVSGDRAEDRDAEQRDPRDRLLVSTTANAASEPPARSTTAASPALGASTPRGVITTIDAESGGEREHAPRAASHRLPAGTG